ncbi:hypothetical protein BFJ69_g13424 [Fusarium oxysporum]|uniref:Uncharacterized protein n=1 Tax=Fusarium oxysporum TaxID=5507 RepID=A0A420MKZ3_FUSOX|nr:hypothetical protein BFJ69_g13424 [Fusarium oxysporum]
MPYYREIQKNKNLRQGIKQITQEITEAKEELEALTSKRPTKQENPQDIQNMMRGTTGSGERFKIIDLGKY